MRRGRFDRSGPFLTVSHLPRLRGRAPGRCGAAVRAEKDALRKISGRAGIRLGRSSWNVAAGRDRSNRDRDSLEAGSVRRCDQL